MSGEGYRVLLQARSVSQHLRAKGFTWDQITDVLALTHRVSPLRLYRLAHGRTAADVVALVNDADLAGTAALRESRLYEFESWPQAGRRPPAHLLTALAKIYQTTARSLAGAENLPSYEAADRELIDGADFGDMDVNRPEPTLRGTMEVDVAVKSADALPIDASACVRLLHATGVEEADVKRRELLFELALVLGGGRALDMLRILTPDEGERLAGVLRSTWRVDEGTVRTFEKLQMHIRRADDGTGPVALLPVTRGQMTAIGRLLSQESMPSSLRDRLLGTYAQLSELTGYLHYDLLDSAGAERLLRDALRAALDLGDPALVGYVHYWLGRIASDQDRTAAVLDHAFAIRSWAARSSSKLLAPLHENLFAAAYAAEGNVAASLRAYEKALALAEAPKDGERAFLNWVSPPVIEIGRIASQVRLNQTGQAIEMAERYLVRHDPRFKRRHGMVLARYASALTQAREIPEAAARLTEAAQITRQHSSARLVDEIGQVRTRLEPWVNTSHVRQLDEALRSCGLTGACPAGGV
ncbi:hypothetical protein ABZ897_27375 [Nonomuraea sp. NPDC046802]|uniref:hypothetical protein n=1 Tax=Nonomuraea sp. NPDC046802 TaxID=3154919 RepID=UPI0033CEA7ED